MSKRRIDPFTPGIPINDPNRFVGRYDEVNTLIDALFNTAKGNSKHLIITGDRGVGKSSLLVQAEKIATGKKDLLELLGIIEEEDFDFETIDFNCSSEQNPAHLVEVVTKKLQSAVRRLFDKIDIEFSIPYLGKIKQKEVDISSELSTLVDDTVAELEKFEKKILAKGKSGLIIFIDELDRVSSGSGFATFLKLITERLAKKGVRNTAFICCGISGVIQKLQQDHPSIERSLIEVPLNRMGREDTRKILETGFSACGIKIGTNVVDKCYQYSAGFPELTHLFGSILLQITQTDEIQVNHFEQALHRIVSSERKNSLENDLKRAGHGRSQSILSVLANGEEEMKVKDIAGQLKVAPNQLGTYISKLKKNDFIVRVRSGEYRFVDPLLREYIKVSKVK